MHPESVWGNTTYLFPFHGSSHLFEGGGEFSNKVMLAIRVPVPHYALQEKRMIVFSQDFFYRSSYRQSELYEEEYVKDVWSITKA